MYYKVKNKESNLYKQLHKMRAEELAIGERNIAAIIEKAGSTWTRFYGYPGQQNMGRTTMYMSFQFTETDKLCKKTWREDKDNPGLWEPNVRTKLGREMKAFLTNGLEYGNFRDVFRILKIDYGHKFTFPFVEICGNTIVLFLGEEARPKSKDLIEITQTEFESIRNPKKSKRAA